MEQPTVITIQASIEAPIAKVWEKWNNPADIIQWNAASDDWHTTKAENDLRPGGTLLSRMEAKDGSMGFDFGAVYDQVITNELIEYTLGDGRKVKIVFETEGDITHVTESFEAETQNSVELQQYGWQAILNNFKKHVEAGL